MCQTGPVWDEKPLFNQRPGVVANKKMLASDSYYLNPVLHFKNMSEVFFAADMPNLDVAELRDLMESMDKEVYFDFLHCVNPEDRGKKEAILDYLSTQEPVLYQTMESMVKAYQTANFLASETRASLMQQYNAYRTAKILAEREHCVPFNEQVEEVAKKDEAPRKKKSEKKRRAPEEVAQIEASNHENVRKTMKSSRATQELDYYSQEKFSLDFPFREFVHWQKKNKKKWDLSKIQEYGTWETIFHVTSQWKAENLAQKQKEQGKKCAIIKRAKGNADTESTSYKVLVGY